MFQISKSILVGVASKCSHVLVHMFRRLPQTYTHTWCLCHTGRQPASVAGRRRNTSSVWKTAWLCWRTRTKPSSRNWKPLKTCTATNLSRNVPECLPGAQQVPVCPHVQRLCTEPCIWMPLPLFYSFAFFLKNCWKICDSTRNPMKRGDKIKNGCWGEYNYTGSLWWSDRTDIEDVLVVTPPKGSIPVPGAWTN